MSQVGVAAHFPRDGRPHKRILSRSDTNLAWVSMSTRAEWLSALAAFESAARHQNFAHAGEELHLTASAVSHHVRKLESRLGLPLFQRHARGVSLTDAGRQLADSASSS